jgi:hypothetical protein
MMAGEDVRLPTMYAWNGSWMLAGMMDAASEWRKRLQRHSKRRLNGCNRINDFAVHEVAKQCCVTTIKAGRRRQLKLSSWDGGFLG